MIALDGVLCVEWNRQSTGSPERKGVGFDEAESLSRPELEIN